MIIITIIMGIVIIFILFLAITVILEYYNPDRNPSQKYLDNLSNRYSNFGFNNILEII